MKVEIDDNSVFVEYNWADVQVERPDLSDEQCKELLEVIYNDLEEALIVAGNNAIALLVSVHAEDTEETD
jgi:hypothetical protein